MTYGLLKRTARGTIPVALVVALASCTMKKEEVPGLTGPSEHFQSIGISVSPDVLQQDGGSQSVVTVTALGPSGEPLRNISMRVGITLGGVPVDFGSLSARSVVTNAEGRATVIYTAPRAPAVGPDNFTIIEIVVTPLGTDFNNTSPRFAAIRLVPPGDVVPPFGLNPNFVFTPSTPLEGAAVLFEACKDPLIPCAPSNNPIVRYEWDFDDGGRASGAQASHAFSFGTFTVTLTVTDQFNRTASTQQIVTVAPSAAPVASFVVSPGSPRVGQTVAFNAGGSTVPLGRTIVSYQWDFGEGAGLQTGSITMNHVYPAAGSYTVTLIVTDDSGKTGVVTRTVTITP